MIKKSFIEFKVMRGFIYLIILFLSLTACHDSEQLIENPLIPSEDPNYAVLQKKMFERQKAFLADNPTGKRSHKYTVYRLISGDKADIQIELDKGHYYYLLADCDDHCHDIDLSLSEDKKPDLVLLANTEADNTPWFEFIPEQSGKYRATIKMEHCAATDCYFGLQILTLPPISNL